MSVIFEQGGAGAPFGTELATLTPQGASDTWHGACGPKAARHKTGRPNLSAQTQAANSGVGAQASTTGAPEVAKAATPSARN